MFISHRGADLAAAEALADELRAAGHEVWFDEWEVGLGDSILGRMDEGLEAATHVVVCYSADGIDSPYMSREWLSALARQLEGHGVRLLPVRLTGGHPPAILTDIKYADLVRDWDAGVKKLLGALG